MPRKYTCKEKAKVPATPPRPSLALTVGVVGHRLDRLAGGAAEKMGNDFEQILAFCACEAENALSRYGDFFSGKPVISLASALAEGADRVAARALFRLKDAAPGQALVNYEIDVPLPFAREEYAKDFITTASTTSVDEYNVFCDRARALLELPGDRSQPGKSYEAAGLTVVSQADILLVVWDRMDAAGRGGTAEIVEAASRSSIPIILVDPVGKAAPTLHWAGLGDSFLPVGRFEDLPPPLPWNSPSALSVVIDKLVRPPQKHLSCDSTHLARRASEQSSLKHYLGEREQLWNIRIGFPALLTLGGRKLSRTDIWPTPPETLVLKYSTFARGFDTRADAQKLAEAYGWADAIGKFFAQCFRSAFVANFLWSALAVGCAAISIVMHDLKPLLVIIEIVLISLILLNTFVGRRNNWHRRWVEGRELAERFRVALPLWMLGLRPATLFSGEEPSWTGWYARAIIRAQGMRAGKLDETGLCAATGMLVAVLDEQRDYHHNSAMHMIKVERCLEGIGSICLGLTMLFAAAFIVVHFGGFVDNSEEHYDGVAGADFGLVVAAFTAGLPAFGAATYGIRVIGDFEGVAHRSERTAEDIDRLVKKIRRFDAPQPWLWHLRSWAGAAANVMLSDMASWRLSAESRGLAIPG